MPFDDLKTLPKPQDWPSHIRPREAAAEPTPTPVAWAVESQRGIEGLYILQSVACYRATHWGEECRVFPLYAAPVAVPAVERHDAATCCGERQEPAKPVEIDGDRPDVGDGWRWLEIGEVMASGDEVAMCNASGQVIQWVTVYEDSLARGNRVTPHLYRFCRRRKTPDQQPLGEFLDEENNQLRAENAALRSEVDRLRLQDHEPETLGTAEHIVRLAGFTQTADDIAAIAARLGGGE